MRLGNVLWFGFLFLFMAAYGTQLVGTDVNDPHWFSRLANLIIVIVLTVVVTLAVVRLRLEHKQRVQAEELRYGLEHMTLMQRFLNFMAPVVVKLMVEQGEEPASSLLRRVHEMITAYLRGSEEDYVAQALELARFMEPGVEGMLRRSWAETATDIWKQWSPTPVPEPLLEGLSKLSNDAPSVGGDD